jgi:two-component system cell cycle response regulator
MPELNTKPAVLLITGSARSANLIDKLLDTYFTVIKVEDAESAWKQLVKQPLITVIICELSIAIDHFGLLERIRTANNKNLAAKPILLLVGEQDQENSCEKAFSLGATDFINMPFSSTELTTRVRLHAQLFINHSADQTIEMQQIASVNVLQQLSNENYFKSRLQHELSFSLRHKINVSVCKLKINNLKAIVAGFDKNAAISVMHAVARMMRQTLRQEDTLAYLGNAEFCILYPATNGIDASTAVNRILDNIKNHNIRIAGKKVPVTISGAISSSLANENTTVEKLMDMVDMQLVEAVNQGGTTIVISPQSDTKQFISVTRAVKLIERGAIDGLEEHAGELMLNIMPLLEYADQVLGLELKQVNQSLRERLDNL